MLVAGLTREQAIIEHRKMWNWIANETLKQKRIVQKKEYFNFFNKEKSYNYCYCCDFVHSYNETCRHCPLMWGKDIKDNCIYLHNGDKGLYDRWWLTTEEYYEEAAALARQIAELHIRRDIYVENN